MFSSAATIATRNSVVSSMMATMQAERPQVTITIEGDDPTAYNGRLGSFSTLDTIKGEVSIVAMADTRFDDIQITFEGQQRTWMDKFSTTPAMSGRSTSTITFLRLNQPVDETTLPIPRIAEKGKKYTFPFTFVVPERLLDSTCTHRVKNDHIREAHLKLPPSAGDPCLPGNGGGLVDDLFPDMTRISYYIQAKLLRRRESDGKRITLGDASRTVRVMPNFEEVPPVHVEDHPGDYILHAEKDIKKGLFKGKMGRLTAEAEQPKDLRLSANSICPATTIVPVTLWFVHVDGSMEPPKLGTLTAKLKISTYFSTSTINYVPSLSARTNDISLGYYGETLLLSSRCMENVKWIKIGPATYKATLLVPITAPKGTILVPSFMTCLMSRAYTLDLSIAVQASTHTSPSVSLKIPLQVSNPSTVSSPADIAANANMDEFYTPRSVAPPSEFEQNRSGLPGYALLASAMPVPPQRIPSPTGISPGCG